MGEGLAGMDGGAVHELQSDGNDTGGDDGIDAGTGHLVGAEGGQHGARALRAAQDAHRHLGDDAELALAAGEQAEPVVAGGVEMVAADLDHLALHGDEFEAEQVVGGDAVAQAMGTARVHRHVAADHAGELAGGVGGVEEALSLHRLGDADIGDAGLHHGEPVGVVDFQDAVQPHQADDHRVFHRQRPAGQRGAGAARHHAHALAMQECHDLGHLRGGIRQRHRQRHLAIGGQPVGFVGFEPERLGDDRIRRQQPAQAGDDGVAAGEHMRQGLGLGDHGSSSWRECEGEWRGRQAVLHPMGVGMSN